MPAAGEKNAFFGGKLKKISVVTGFRNRHYTLTAVSVSHTLREIMENPIRGNFSDYSPPCFKSPDNKGGIVAN